MVECQVRNTGCYSGAETIQIYGKKNQGFITPREKELVAFKKVFLAPNEVQTVEIMIPKERLYYLDEKFKEVLPSSIQFTVEASNFKQSYNHSFIKVETDEKKT
ncbi:fibronectin type III-like domain-contianing protein [Enterococcus villorum]|uniref:fibronectin type III-like domain-contianing protein n=1 Tax=Enterococcus villorum TaxID=112904 RepID=UPI0023AB5399|nr:fibronectin type III-like domain-contianing protein [Enterococcus villorum]